jgi:hypothetical protein
LGLIRVRKFAGGFRSRVLTAFAVLAVVASGLTVGSLATPAAPAEAASVPFDPGYIISDANFFNGGAMTEAQIQAFLNSTGSVLATYRSTVSSRAARPSADIPGHIYCNAFQGGSNLLASTIIYRAQVACGISAKVILVTLQKERTLITKTPAQAIPNDFLVAMGYGCPDTAPCNDLYFGFGNQVYMASLQFKFYQRPENRFNFQPGVRFIQYSPTASCGGTNVNIANWGTAALYNYTPYQPNPASLAAYPGAAPGGCGAYGNRNFANFYTEWFGSPTGGAAEITPKGDLNAVTTRTGGVTVRGWAFDPETTNAIWVDVTANGVYKASIRANAARPDVQAAFPNQSANHGYLADINLPAGRHEVCTWAINVGAGTVNPKLGCRTVTVASAPVTPEPIPTTPTQPVPTNDRGNLPRGDVNDIRASGTTATLRGWAFDADSTLPIFVDVWVNGAWKASVYANAPRPDVKAAYPAQGNNHGFSAPLTLPAGTHQVCVYAINAGRGANPLLECQTVRIAAATTPPTTPPPTTPPTTPPPTSGTAVPRGDLNHVRAAAAGMVNAKGWAFDPDTTAPIYVDMWVDGAWKASILANVARPDVKAAFPAQGDNHGFAQNVAVPSGARSVCFYAINTGAGVHPLIGCQTVTVP